MLIFLRLVFGIMFLVYLFDTKKHLNSIGEINNKLRHAVFLVEPIPTIRTEKTDMQLGDSKKYQNTFYNSKEYLLQQLPIHQIKLVNASIILVFAIYMVSASVFNDAVTTTKNIIYSDLRITSLEGSNQFDAIKNQVTDNVVLSVSYTDLSNPSSGFLFFKSDKNVVVQEVHVKLADVTVPVVQHESTDRNILGFIFNVSEEYNLLLPR